MLRTALLILLITSNCYATTFYVGKKDPNFIEIPPANKEQVQKWKKLKWRLSKPIILRSPDLNGDGIVNLYDYAILANKWLERIK